MNKQLLFIGGGNMATSLIGGLLANTCRAEQISVAEPDAQKRQQLESQFGVSTVEDSTTAIASADIVILAVKPQILQTVCRHIREAVQVRQPLIISIAAGIRSDDIDRWCGGQCAVVRCMPNTPALVQLGASGLYANALVSQPQQDDAETILAAVGITLWVKDEAHIDTVTAVSGSGPAYCFLLMEAMQQAGVQLGLDDETAMKLTVQTALGAATMAASSSDTPRQLREKVTSKGGTTAAAIERFQQLNFNDMVSQALLAARDRATQLANELGKDE